MASSTEVASSQARAPEAPSGPDRAADPLAMADQEQWYDRSSIRHDALVAIEDQTPEDFERLAPENAFCDYIDGVVYIPSPVSDRHQHLSGFFYHLLDGLSCERPIGEVLRGPAVLRVGERRKLEPDVFVRPAGPPRPDQPPAMLVIEVHSRSTRDFDLGKKLTIYRDAGIPEIWLVDELGRDRSVIVERKVGEGYHREGDSEGRPSSTAIPGFWIEVSWLWE
ncbi:Uma2 family endonuclease [Tautonia plasticadhaerens]|uniref:Putative restriction endonuclease domain-containing protein n=1 Tax=Tautonia plasticadhaerens TaxID=2527974 RepID=A0A518GVA0_9BACT|nr:Uma2 family endonuclease [Tautonia plasticadhaerens]QDV32519.1 hypothetical protein ElP_03520 [Tautonia plasticadhaerens]